MLVDVLCHDRLMMHVLQAAPHGVAACLCFLVRKGTGNPCGLPQTQHPSKMRGGLVTNMSAAAVLAVLLRLSGITGQSAVHGLSLKSHKMEPAAWHEGDGL